MKNFILKILLPIISGILLTISFPKFGFSTIIYVSLIPLFLSLSKIKFKETILASFLSGLTFFIFSLIWLVNVIQYTENNLEDFGIFFGYLFLSSYCALFFIPFGVIAKWCFDKWLGFSLLKNIQIMISLTFLWVSLEFLRGQLFTGFPWNFLGISQYLNPSIIQIASFGGVSIVSAIIVWMNLGVFITLKQYLLGINNKKYRPHYEFMIGIIPIALSISFGIQSIFSSNSNDHKKFSIALIQPNINQKEINSLKTNMINNKLLSESIYLKMSEQVDRVLTNPNIDLLVLPETSLDYFNSDFYKRKLIDKVVKKTTLLAGSSYFEINNKDQIKFYNSSILYNDISQNKISTKYFKQHLVPFGEYLPFINSLKKLVPLENTNFSSGKKSTIFRVKDLPSFSVLICFEDVFSELAKNAVANNAKWIINQTNDGWFDPSSQSEQHLSHAVFRCVENNIPMVRACNTGVSCIIDKKGRIVQRLDPLKEGFIISSIGIDNNSNKTFYASNGDIFAKLSLIVSFLFLSLFLLDVKNKKIKLDF